MSTAQPKPEHSLLPLAHEALGALIGPGFRKVAEQAVAEIRLRPGWTPTDTLAPGSLQGLTCLQEFLEAYGYLCFQQGATEEEAAEDANWLGQHFGYLLNYLLHHRKTFWVDEPLAWMLANTHLDIEGRALNLPFPSFAVAFTDRATCERAEQLMARDPATENTAPVQAVTVYVTRLAGQGDGLGITFSILADRRDERWPYLVTRDLLVRPTDDLESLLNSHFPEVEVNKLDPLFSSQELKSLLHLVINAILYATSYSDSWPVLASPVKGLRRAGKGKGDKRRQRMEGQADALARRQCSEDVFHLPGKIPISQLRVLQALGKSESGRELFARFMVRGHWRRANPTWTEQHLRWIEPYWKGPEMAAVIEKEYQLKV